MTFTLLGMAAKLDEPSAKGAVHSAVEGFSGLGAIDILTIVLIAQAAIPSSFSPLATILSASSGNGRCSSRAFGASAASQRSTSAGVVRMTGMAFG